MKLDDLHHKLLDDLEDIFGQCAFEPSERGAGLAFTDDARQKCVDILKRYGVRFVE